MGSLSRRSLMSGLSAAGLSAACGSRAPAAARPVAAAPSSPTPAPRVPGDPDPPVIALSIDEFALDDTVMATWVQERANAVAAFHAGFPVEWVDMRLRAVGGAGVGFGRVFIENGSANVRIDVGRDTRTTQLRKDWVLVHEMIHLAIPMMARRHRWFDEGTATYLEPLIRARIGNVDARYVWDQFVWGMPKGRPRPGDEGLDRTPTWGRTYWGGALFSLVADVRIRVETDGAHGLDHAWQAVVREGPGRLEHWPIERILRVGDAATGRTVLTDLYREWAHHPADVDLEDLWAKLGVLHDGDDLVDLDDDAPWASVRRALTDPPMPTPPALPRVNTV